MDFFKLGKKKKEESLDIPMPAPDFQAPQAPVHQIVMMKQQGYTNNQILQILQGQGYNTSSIYEALNQAGLANDRNARESVETDMPDYGQAYSQPQQPSFQGFEMPQETKASPSINEERIQEVAEAIIDEKWEELAKDIRKVIEWKEKSEERISKIEQQILDLRMSIDSLTKNIMSKISSYDQNITEVGTEIKAMEKVFQKVLPTLTESVNKLDRMTKTPNQPQQQKK